MIDLRIERVENGYIVTVGEHRAKQEGHGTTLVTDEMHIAATQDDVAKVVKSICRGAFDEKKEDGIDE